MSKTVEDLIVVFGGNAALLIALAFLLRSILIHRLTKDIRVFEAELKAKADSSIEEAKHAMQLAATEHQVRFSKLHEKRADVLAELYTRIVRAFWAGQSFVSPLAFTGEPTKQEKYTEAVQKLKDTAIFFDTNRIYLPESICTMLDKFITILHEPTIELGSYLEIQDYDPETHKERRAAWRKAWNAFESDIPAARHAIEVEFRRMLGDETPVAAKAAAGT